MNRAAQSRAVETAILSRLYQRHPNEGEMLKHLGNSNATQGN